MSLVDLADRESDTLFVSRQKNLGDSAVLYWMRNKYKLKHAMLGAMIWDSMTSDFQLEIIGDDKAFKSGEEYNGVALWYFIRE